jgi:flagellar assembly protein FliH
MTSTSSEPVVLRDLPVGAVATADSSHDLREGAWTRFGGGRVLGDQVTEHTLRAIAERTHATARAQGFAAGWSDGLRAAQARSTATRDEQAVAFEQHRRRALDELESAAAALATAVERCGEATRQLHAELADRAVDLALEIAATVLDREVALASDPAADAVRRALTVLADDVPFVVRLHPEDRAVLDPAVLAGLPATVVADAAVGRGDAVVETEDGFVDADLAGALDRVRTVLGR